jgi:hypothetical protein
MRRNQFGKNGRKIYPPQASYDEEKWVEDCYSLWLSMHTNA